MKHVLLYHVSVDWAFLTYRLPMARAARDAGFDVHVATQVDQHADAIRAEGFTLHPIPFRRGGLSPFASIATALALRRLQNKLSPEIIHHVGLQCCVLGGIASLGTKTRQVHAFTGLGYIFTGASSSRGRLLRLVIAAALRFFINQHPAVALVQNPDDRKVLENFGILPDRISLIPGSGVDTEIFQPQPEPDEPVTIGFVGRLLTDKGIRALVSAHRILHARGLDTRLLIAGEPDPANPASVTEAEAKSWDSEPGITRLGHVKNIADLWRRSHIAVLPSHREGLPKSLLEAASCGRPMIATDVPGCREIVIADQTGLLVPVENPQALADAIGKLAASKELRSRYGAAARQLVVEKLSAKAIGKEIVARYYYLLRERDYK